MNIKNRVLIIGGGASGFFAALRIKDKNPNADVSIFEASNNFLKKVRISGGGRCNVAHNIFEVSDFTKNYPRGQKELKSPFYTFHTKDTLSWFKERGVEIKAEADGRMFPVTNKSDTIIDCFLNEAKKLQIKTFKKYNVQKVEKKGSAFSVLVKDQGEFAFDHLIIATGSSPTGYRFAKSLGHSITDLAPSLFSFKITHPLLTDKSGTSFQNARLKVKIQNDLDPKKNKSFHQKGPLLITHWGLSGPAILKISAWAARHFKKSDYKGDLFVNWLGIDSLESANELMQNLKEEHSKTSLKNAHPKGLTKSFWGRVLSYLEMNLDQKYIETSSKDLRKIADLLFSTKFQIDGKNRYKDEFVECGGVNLKEINFKTMESKITKNLYITGELLDVDGITGGFNFQNAWTSGFIAGSSVSDQIPT